MGLYLKYNKVKTLISIKCILIFPLKYFRTHRLAFPFFSLSILFIKKKKKEENFLLTHTLTVPRHNLTFLKTFPWFPSPVALHNELYVVEELVLFSSCPGSDVIEVCFFPFHTLKCLCSAWSTLVLGACSWPLGLDLVIWWVWKRVHLEELP